MFKQLWILERLRVLLLQLLEISVGLVPGDAIDEIANQIQLVLLVFLKWQLLFNGLEIFEDLFLTCDASLELWLLNCKQFSRVPWKTYGDDA